MQQAIKKINYLAIKNVFRISKSKTRSGIFGQLTKMQKDPTVKRDSIEIPVIYNFKFHGLIFDKILPSSPT